MYHTMYQRAFETIIKNVTNFNHPAHLLTKFKMGFAYIQLIYLGWLTFMSPYDPPKKLIIVLA